MGDVAEQRLVQFLMDYRNLTFNPNDSVKHHFSLDF